MEDSLRFNSYRMMWVIVLFDLPTETKEEKKNHSQFRKSLLKEGFNMFQFSIYSRPCGSREVADKFIAKVKKLLPEKGHVGILSITDKQFGSMEIFYGFEKKKPPKMPEQLSMF